MAYYEHGGITIYHGEAARAGDSTVKKTTIHEDEWLAELLASQKHNDKGMTKWELAAAWGCSERTALTRIKLAARKGLLVVGFRTETRVDGVPCKVPVYTFRKKHSG